MEYPKIETLYTRDAQFKVDSTQIKNRVYGVIRSWLWTEKIDGTNMRAIWEPETKTLKLAGRTDNANIPGDLLDWMRKNISVETLNTIFSGSPAIIYGEGYGAGIQKGGGDYSPIKKFIVFDVLVDGKWWLSREDVTEIATKLNLDVVPSFGEMDLDRATGLVKTGFQSKLNDGKKQAEGLVGRTVETLFDKKGARLIVKLKTKDF